MGNDASKRRLVSLILIVAAIVIIVIMATVLSKRGNAGQNNQANNTTQENYQVGNDGTKTNTSQQVSENKTVGNIVIERSAIVYEGGMSKLTSKVTNDSVAKDNLRFTVKFIANDGSVIAESVGYVGSIKANETKYIDSSITADVANAKDIKYEIMQ